MAWYRPPVEERDEGGAILRAGPVVAWLGLWGALLAWHVDDAGISYAYARSLAAGHGFVAYAGAPVAEGFSNPAWTMLLAACSALGIPLLVASKALQALLGAGTLLAVHRGVRASGGERVEAATAALAAALSSPWAVWSAGGLETAWLGFCLAGFFAVVASGGPGWLAGLLVAGTALARPEGPVLAVSLLLAAEILVGRERWGPKRITAWSLGLLAIAGWIAVRVMVFDAFWPTAFWVKVATLPPGLRLLKGTMYVSTFAAQTALPLLVLGWGAAWAMQRLGRLARALALVVGVNFVVVALVGGDWMRHGRLLAHVAPLIAMAGVPGLLALLFRPHDVGRRLLSGWARHLAWMFAAAYAGIQLLFWQNALRNPVLPMALAADSADLLAALGPAWCGAGPPHLATPDVGAALFRHPEARVIDLGGLIDPIDAREAGPDWWPRRLAEARPQAVLVHGVWVPRTGLDEGAMAGAGYRVVCWRSGTPGLLEDRFPPTLYRRTDCREDLPPPLAARLKDWCRRPR